MKPFQIFKPGTHRASNGQVIEFTEQMLREAASAYDPSTHEAPIVVGHPRTNGPAYGWVASLSFDESGAIVATPQQVDPEFAKMVEAGRYKKRSASWYLPDAPNNPKPGTMYLRHVGFLGAQPPAVKGLKEVEFNDAEDGVVEFALPEKWAFRGLAEVLRNLREWLIAEKGLETADRVVPVYAISDVSGAEAAQDKEEESQQAAMARSFSEETPMKIEELQARVAALEAENAKLKANQMPADFSEREAALAAREAAVAKAEAQAARAAVEARVDAIVRAGRLLPGKAKSVVDFALSLSSGEVTLDFGEGDKREKLSQREAYLRMLETGPKVVEFGELSGAAAGGQPGDKASDPEAIAEKARELVKESEAKGGKVLSYTEAVTQVMQSEQH